MVEPQQRALPFHALPIVVAGSLGLLACGGGTPARADDAGGDASPEDGHAPPEDGEARDIPEIPDVPDADVPDADVPDADAVDAAPPTGLFGPEHLVYRGAFRLPRTENPPPYTFSWGGTAMTYYPDGDPGGTEGPPGSLIVAGNDAESPDSRAALFAEVSIPEPVASRELAVLPTAELLQDFVDLRGDALYGPSIWFELPKVGVQYLPAQAGQPAGGLYLAWGQHIESETAPAGCGAGDPSCVPSHSWRPLGPGGDLDAEPTAGPWWLVGCSLFSVNDYLFEIPAAWADEHVAGRRLATGRFPDGGQGSQGPVLVALAPWLDGSPPPPGATLGTTVLLHYSTVGVGTERLDGYQHPDEWVGGAWLTGATRTAVVFAGAKGVGEQYWYGWQRCPGGLVPCIEPEAIGGPGCFAADGSPCGLGAEYYCDCDASACDPACVGERGWWTQRWEAQLLFYDPADLAGVAAGSASPGQPQPYARLGIDDRLFLTTPAGNEGIYGTGDQRRYRLGAVAYDRARNLLYVAELHGDVEVEQPLVHVWAVVEE
jgi:hypothetical protein